MYGELNPIVSMICETVAARKVILYGIKYGVTGEEIREVKLCIVADGDPDESKRKLYSVLDAEYPINLLVYSTDVFTQLMSDSTSYAASIMNKGVALYE